jgi:hypothetical protein
VPLAHVRRWREEKRICYFNQWFREGMESSDKTRGSEDLRRRGIRTITTNVRCYFINQGDQGNKPEKKSAEEQVQSAAAVPP